jgi:hypothetical protein
MGDQLSRGLFGLSTRQKAWRVKRELAGFLFIWFVWLNETSQIGKIAGWCV